MGGFRVGSEGGAVMTLAAVAPMPRGSSFNCELTIERNEKLAKLAAVIAKRRRPAIGKGEENPVAFRTAFTGEDWHDNPKSILHNDLAAVRAIYGGGDLIVPWNRHIFDPFGSRISLSVGQRANVDERQCVVRRLNRMKSAADREDQRRLPR
jgi:hypothetical protein